MPEPDPPETEHLGLKRGRRVGGGRGEWERRGETYIHKKKKKTGETKEYERLYSR